MVKNLIIQLMQKNIKNGLIQKKLYIIVETKVHRGGFKDKKIFGCYENIDIANIDLGKLEKRLQHESIYSIRYFLETIVISEESLIK